MSPAQALRVRIGELELDERKRELRAARGPIAIQPKVFDVLVYLVRERERVVPRDELQRAVWGGTAVAPDSITRAVREVRRLLGPGPEMVRTYPGRGVRFVGPVTEPVVDVVQPAGTRPPVAEPASPPPADPADELFGRARALAALEAVIVRAAASGGSIRIVLGAPGTGKSALLAAVEHRVRTAGTAVVCAAPAEALEPLVASATARGEVVVVLHDDLAQAAAAGTDARRLAAAVAGSRVVVIASCCSSARRDPQVGAVLAAATRADPDAIVPLGALEPAALAALAARVLDRPVSPAGLAKLEALTGGNPRFARHVLHLARQAERPLETLDAVPASFGDRLRELVLEHVGVVAPGTRALLEANAILELPFTVDVAAEIAAIDAGEAADALAEAASVGLVVEVGAGRWRFAHELVRAVIERALPPSRRAVLHARAAAVLDRWLGTPPSQLDLITRHYVAGASVAHAPRALELVRRVAQAAVDRHAFGAAARWLAIALDVEALLEPRLPGRRRALWLELAKMLSRDGQVERAADAFAASESDAASARRDGGAERAAFLLVAPALPRIIDCFYELMFARHPQLRPMFTRPPSLQRRMFGETIAAFVDHADDPEWLHGHLEALGRRHAEYGTTPEMYGWARAAFLDAIEAGLAPRRLPDDVRETWARTFDAISEAMIAAADAADAERRISSAATRSSAGRARPPASTR